MPLTTPDLVRAHLLGQRLSEAIVTGESVVLHGTGPAQLAHSGIKPGTAVVKSHRDAPPERETRVLGNDWAALSHTRLVPHSILCAADSSLGVIYSEDADFVVDTAGGRIRRLESGAIPSGAAVNLWYDYFQIYAEGDDYTVDDLESRIQRISTGAIADGQVVEVDYVVSPGSIPDTAIENAITEASEAVLAFTDPRFYEEPTPGLVIGETHWAVAALCRMRAASVLAESISGVQSLAGSWITLAAQYDQSGRRHLAPYVPALPQRHSPRIN